MTPFETELKGKEEEFYDEDITYVAYLKKDVLSAKRKDDTRIKKLIFDGLKEHKFELRESLEKQEFELRRMFNLGIDRAKQLVEKIL